MIQFSFKDFIWCMICQQFPWQRIAPGFNVNNFLKRIVIDVITLRNESANKGQLSSTEAIHAFFDEFLQTFLSGIFHDYV